MFIRDRGLISTTITRSYMKAVRELLGLTQYDVLWGLKECNDTRIHEANISLIEGKIGYPKLQSFYAEYIHKKIDEEQDHSEDIKEIMKSLLSKWEEA